MRYPLTFYVAGWPLNDWMAGAAIGPVVFVRKGYESDQGLYRHELTHVWQWVSTLGMHSLFYLCSAGYRLEAEAEAYRMQMQYPDRKGNKMTLETGAWRLFGGGKDAYDLGITLEQAKAALQVQTLSQSGPE